MTNYQAMADEIVGHGVAVKHSKLGYRVKGYQFWAESDKEFCHDPRVAMALMKKACLNNMMSIESWETADPDEPQQWAVDFGGPRCADDESLELAITKACLGALRED